MCLLSISNTGGGCVLHQFTRKSITNAKYQAIGQESFHYRQLILTLSVTSLFKHLDFG
jgi:hypothetical protein